jgi:acetylornithine deacetylase/succinyl-diaminopimelate desuccinylase-like protein
MEAGHAANALPQRAAVNINCRIFPGHAVEDVRVALETIVNDPRVKISVVAPISPAPPPPPLTAAIMGPVETAAARIWPGTPVVPVMATGASDGRFLSAAGIPTYGVTGFFYDPAGSNAHGLDEHISVRSLMEGRDFLHELIKLYAVQK